ncbi:hypothetical protein [Spirochaeta africana]|uniref:Uncharacterized protein n=1 Tax=Spirochaeta africana (strain ATCC 700263 / DSM 8902 / Z-7692) TaxID=889378 RepID=H9UFA0_SPIAZ|nr:hypothetical protein [Spirochaeta africana]AFG36193.1 hypothetical protein Spiaf_0084 [Spirochaeta africana DSM 8902]
MSRLPGDCRGTQRPLLLRAVLLLVILLAAAPWLAADNRLEATFWAELSPRPVPGRIPEPGEHDGDLQQLLFEDDVLHGELVPPAEQRILEEARLVFSGLIYGWHFRYVPRNDARGYPEQFEADPLYELPWGDERLRIRQTWRENGRLYAKVEYRLDADQQARRRAWGSSSTQLVQGRGTASYYAGHEQRQLAVEDALRMAIREHLRARMHTPPRQVEGRIVLADPPVMGVDGGSYTALLRARMQIHRIRHYEVF